MPVFIGLARWVHITGKLNKTAQWQRRVVLKLACGAGLTAAITLAGVASMLWTALPGLTLAQHWPLWAPPLVPALGASWAAWAAREGTSVPPFAALQRQLVSDGDWLRETRSETGAS